MRAPLTPDALAAKRYRRAGFLRRGLNSLFYGALIGVALTFVLHQSLWLSIGRSMHCGRQATPISKTALGGSRARTTAMRRIA